MDEIIKALRDNGAAIAIQWESGKICISGATDNMNIVQRLVLIERLKALPSDSLVIEIEKVCRELNK